MALDNEEMNERRARREQLRKQRLAQQRQLKLRLLITAAVLIVCGILIFAVRKGRFQPGTSEEPSQMAATQAAPQPPEQTEPEPTEPVTVIHFAAAGDLNICDEVVNSGGLGYDYGPVFLDVLPLLADADLTAMNFEGNLVGAPYGTDTVSAPQELLTALADAGVDILQLANSRTISNGMIGLASTLQAVRAAGLEPVGAYETNKAFQQSGGYTIREVNGVRVAIVAFTKGMDSMALPDGNENCVNLLYTDYSTTYQQVNRDGITKILRAAEAEAPDITIALLHWGSEYNDVISSSQKDIQELMLDEGVDVILGTHSHYVQAMEFDREKGTFVCYSLGDFFGSAVRAGTNYSVIINLEITKDNETGITKVTDYTYAPIYTVTDGGSYRVVRIQQAMTGFESNYLEKVSSETYDGMVNALERIEDRVTPDG